MGSFKQSKRKLGILARGRRFVENPLLDQLGSLLLDELGS